MPAARPGYLYCDGTSHCNRQPQRYALVGMKYAAVHSVLWRAMLATLCLLTAIAEVVTVLAMQMPKVHMSQRCTDIPCASVTGLPHPCSQLLATQNASFVYMHVSPLGLTGGETRTLCTEPSCEPAVLRTIVFLRACSLTSVLRSDTCSSTSDKRSDILPT